MIDQEVSEDLYNTLKAFMYKQDIPKDILISFLKLYINEYETRGLK